MTTSGGIGLATEEAYNGIDRLANFLLGPLHVIQKFDNIGAIKQFQCIHYVIVLEQRFTKIHGYFADIISSQLCKHNTLENSQFKYEIVKPLLLVVMIKLYFWFVMFLMD